MPDPGFANLTVVDHPLIRHKLTLLRDQRTRARDFRLLVSEIAMLMAFAATDDLPLEPCDVDTPLERTRGVRLQNLTLVPILRAGLGMLDGLLHVLPSARVGHIGLSRDHETLRPVDYYFNVPDDVRDQLCIVLDPMLATGGSAAAAATALKAAGATAIRLLCIVAAPPGVARMRDRHPDVRIYAAVLDRELDARGYILPGLGDAGDRLYGTGRP